MTYDISLILCTIRTENRRPQIHRLMESLANQESDRSFEVVIVSQDRDPVVVEEILDSFAGRLVLSHIRSEEGLSLARNRGIAAAKGSNVGFPDDDCWYPPSIVHDVCSFFELNQTYDGVHGMSTDGAGTPIARFARHSGELWPGGVFERTCSVSMFYRRQCLEDEGGFDTNFGLGARTKWQGAEDYELPMRLLSGGRRIRYEADLDIHHPVPGRPGSGGSVARAKSQAPSLGRVMRMHHIPLPIVIGKVARPAAGVMWSVVRCAPVEARFYYEVARGRVIGYLSPVGA